MPFGEKPSSGGGTIKFDAIYAQLIKPAIEAAGMQAIRADEEMAGGVIHKPMFERLLLCEYAVADLTAANANVFYELGVRHAVRPWSTVLLYAERGGRLPFDVGMLRALPYRLDDAGRPATPAEDGDALADRLRAARDGNADSPLFQLVEGYPEIDHTKTDVFRARVDYAEQQKQRLAQARGEGPAAVRSVEHDLGPLENVEAGLLIDLLLSYRAVRAWTDMISLTDRMPRPLAATVMVREQLAFALNRADRGEEAEGILLDLLEKNGPSSETYGILGRVYKDRWEKALQRSEVLLARGLLDRAIEAYLRGFEADWRDAYPGINAVTLMELREPPDPRRKELLPVVRYSVERRLATGQPDFWDHATRVELAVLAKDESAATTAVGDALAAVREKWEPETTARNLRLIREARDRRGEVVPWAQEIEVALAQRSVP